MRIRMEEEDLRTKQHQIKMGLRTTNKKKTQDVQNQYLLNFSFCNFTSAEYLTYPNWSLAIFFKQD